MPKKNIDWSNAIIYKLVCKDPEVKHCYVGSTTNFNQRKRQHKSACIVEQYKRYNRLVYKTIRENGGWENWQMTQIESYPCDTKLEAHTRERYWLETLAADLNKYVPYQTKEERAEYLKEYLKEYRGNYYEENKSKMFEPVTCECGCTVTRKHLQCHRKSQKHIQYMQQFVLGDSLRQPTL